MLRTRTLTLAATVGSVVVFHSAALADGQREGVAHVIVESGVIGFKHTGQKWEKWDNGGALDAEQMKALTAAASEAAIYTKDPEAIAWTKLADVVAGIWSGSKSKTDPPDPRGLATLTVGGRQQGPTIVLPIAHDTYTPDWSALLDWSHVPLNEDVRIRLQLWDSDDAKKPNGDPKIGTVVLTSDDLKRALRDGHVYSIYTGEQSNDQIVAVKVTVMLDVYEDANKAAPDEDTPEMRIFLGFFDKLVDIVESDKDDCSKMAGDLNRLINDNLMMLAQLKEAEAKGQKLTPTAKAHVEAQTKRLIAAMTKCGNDKRVQAALTRLK